MTLREWIRRSFPGQERVFGSELKIRHGDGSVSSLWLREERQQIPDTLSGLAAIYGEIDGADLFSSAFKIASIAEPRSSGGVLVVPSLAGMATAAAEERTCLPAAATVFMEQAGIGFYSATRDGIIFEHDVETGEVTTYQDVTAILDEWLAAIRE
jgi:hypothetical protein